MKYAIVISDVDEDWEHKEFTIYETQIFDTEEEAKKKMKELEEDEEYQYQEFKIATIYGPAKKCGSINCKDYEECENQGFDETCPDFEVKQNDNTE